MSCAICCSASQKSLTTGLALPCSDDPRGRYRYTICTSQGDRLKVMLINPTRYLLRYGVLGLCSAAINTLHTMHTTRLEFLHGNVAFFVHYPSFLVCATPRVYDTVHTAMLRMITAIAPSAERGPRSSSRRPSQTSLRAKSCWKSSGCCPAACASARKKPAAGRGGSETNLACPAGSKLAAARAGHERKSRTDKERSEVAAG